MRARQATIALCAVLASVAVPAAYADHDPALVGAWRGRDGALVGIVTSVGQRARFFADHPIHCSLLPCPPRRIAGTWRTRGGRLVLRPRRARPIALGYRIEGDRLTLLARDRIEVAHLERVPTYCAAASDCARQDYPRPRCIGEDVCVDQTCGWTCTAGASGCESYRCAGGEHCVEGADGPECVGEESACPVRLCPPGRPHCIGVGDETACVPPDECHRDTDCARGETCQLEFVCVRAPCLAPLVCG
jgi:hypothetical protein